MITISSHEMRWQGKWKWDKYNELMWNDSSSETSEEISSACKSQPQQNKLMEAYSQTL